LILEYYTDHKTERGPSIRELYFGQGYPGINSWTVAAYDDVPTPDGVITWEKSGSSTVEHIVIDRYALHHSHGLIMPLLHIHNVANQGKHWFLWFTLSGKAGPRDWQEIRKQIDAGYDVVTFDFRGLGETRMLYKAVSEDDPSLALLDDVQAYVNPLSSVLAGYVYNSLLTGRPYFLQMIEDAEIALRFSRETLHASTISIASDGQGSALADAIARTLPRMELSSYPTTDVIKWSDLVIQRREQWPIEYLLPGGAYIQ
jgi:pimeloyl-ACP methyl ester carboxylesterase